MADERMLMALVEGVLPLITEIRHRIHSNPELALEEHDTAALVRETLQPANVRLLLPLMDTDVIGILSGSGDGPNVTLRADMDALPIKEETGLPYMSRKDGLMHACGHDGHTAVLLGAALVLSNLQDAFEGTVRFVFQPGEEAAAAGRILVEKGALRNPEPQAVIALHAWPYIAEGVIASRPGGMMAAADFFKITIKGRGGHGSMPDRTIDPILTAARIVEGLQSIVARNISPLDPAVVSVCHFCGGTNSNVIPDSVMLEGTARYLRPDVGKLIPDLIERTVQGVCQSMGALYEMAYNASYLPVINDAGVVALGEETARTHLGDDFWMELENPSMGGEDFSFYIQDYPGAFFRLGMGESSPGLHNSLFDFNDGALKNGILFMVASALRALK